MIKSAKLKAVVSLVNSILVNNGIESVIHSFEAGRRGKPDEIDDSIAQLIGSYILNENRDYRFDIRILGQWNNEQDIPKVQVQGEFSETLLRKEGLYQDICDIVINHYNKVNRTEFTKDTFEVIFEPTPQSDTLSTNGYAGDSGHAVAVAYKDTPNHLPWERFISVGLRDLIDSIFENEGVIPDEFAGKGNVLYLPNLGSDGKVQVDAEYVGAYFEKLTRITLALEQKENLDVETLRKKINPVVNSYLHFLETKYDVYLGNPEIIVNGRGNWYNKDAGWKVDKGNREAKPHRHVFSTYGVATDSITGEDPTKPDLTASLMSRYIACQIVGNGLADYARVTLSYCIGREGMSVGINTNNTAKVSQKTIEQWISQNVSLGINDAISYFGLKDSDLYEKLANDSDFFQDENLLWNKVDLKYY